MSNVSSEQMKKIKIRSRASSNRSDNAPQVMCEFRSNELGPDQKGIQLIKLTNLKQNIMQ